MNRFNEVDTFNRAALLVHKDEGLEALTRNMLAALRWIAPGDVSLVNWVGLPGTPLMTVYDDPQLVNSDINAGVHRNLHDHPTYGMRTDRALCISDVYSASRWRNTALYDEGHGLAGQEDDIGLDFDFGSGRMLTLCVTRGRRGFTDAERRMFEMLAAHVRLAFGRLRLNGPDDASENTVHMRRISVDEEGEIRFPDPDIRETLERYLGRRAMIRDRFPDAIVRWIKSGVARHRDRQAPLSSHIPYRLGRSDRTLSLSLVPSAGDTHHTIMIEERVRRSRGPDVSSREREILAWLASGKSNAEIALILGISAGTVKRHLENIYAKLGVEGRHAAVVRAMTLGVIS